jgi:hypothetical protein
LTPPPWPPQPPPGRLQTRLDSVDVDGNVGHLTALREDQMPILDHTIVTAHDH